MTRERTEMRAGARWQPVAPRSTMAKRVAGRRSAPAARVPALSLPRVHVRRSFVLPLLIMGAAVIGGWWLYRSPLLSVRSVSVSGNVALPADGLKQVAGIEGQSLIRPDFAAAERRLDALPMVKDARVSRAWPFGAKITVVERRPWGVWSASGGQFVIDEDGVVLGLPAPQGAPVITQTDSGPALSPGARVDAGAIDVAKRLAATSQQALGRSVTGFEFSQATGLTAVFDGGLRVDFGDAQGYDFKLATLFALLQKAQNENTELHSIDLRFGNLVAVQ